MTQAQWAAHQTLVYADTLPGQAMFNAFQSAIQQTFQRAGLEADCVAQYFRGTDASGAVCSAPAYAFVVDGLPLSLEGDIGWAAIGQRLGQHLCFISPPEIDPDRDAIVLPLPNYQDEPARLRYVQSTMRVLEAVFSRSMLEQQTPASPSVRSPGPRL